MYQVYFTNHFYYSDRQFATFDEAVAYAKSTCFDCRIDCNGEMVGAWSYFGGFRRYSKEVA